MKEHEFRENAALAKELRSLLDLPTMRLALDIVGEKARTRTLPSPRPAVPYDTLLAHQLNRALGIQRALDWLQVLTEPNPLVPESEGVMDDDLENQPFFSSLPPNMKEAIRKQRQDS